MENIKLSEQDSKVFVAALEKDNIEINENFIKAALKHRDTINTLNI